MELSERDKKVLAGVEKKLLRSPSIDRVDLILIFLKEELTANLKELTGKWRIQSESSREEATRIRRIIKEPTDAEERCNARAETWEACAKEVDGLLQATTEPQERKLRGDDALGLFRWIGTTSSNLEGSKMLACADGSLDVTLAGGLWEEFDAVLLKNETGLPVGAKG